MMQGVLIGVLGNAAFNILKNLLKKIFEGIHEQDPIINKTYQALEKTCKRFFDHYGKAFGSPHESFLARLENHEILLRRIYLDSEGLSTGKMNPNGFNNSPRATDEALEFLVRVFEEELKKDRELLRELDIIKHHRKTDRIESMLKEQTHPPVIEKKRLMTSLPSRQVHLFGREQELYDLEQHVNQTRHVLLVNGLGGIGKTEVCKRFFHDHYCEFQHAAWIDYVSSIKESFVNALGSERSGLVQPNPADTLDDRFVKIIQALCGLDDNTLLIIDNIEDARDPDLDRLCALPANIKIIANSRLTLRGFDVLSLDFLSAESCKTLFYDHYKGQKNDEDVEEIITLCGRHTLTVELLARTAQNAAMPVKTLHKTLKEKGFNLNELIHEKVDTFWHNEKERKQFFDHLLTIFDLSRVTEDELYVLTNLSVLPPIYMDMNEFSEWLGLKSKDDINSLKDKGWLKQEGFEIFMHQVIQEVIRHKTAPGVRTCGKLIIAIANHLYKEPGANPLDKKRYVLFGDSILQYIKDFHKDAARLANNLSLIYKAQGQLEPALEFQKKTVKIFEKILDKNHPSSATSYNNLSTIYHSLGQLEPALEFQKKTVEIFEKILDKNHPSLATSYNNLSTIYQAMGQLEKALKFQKKALEIREAVLVKNHPDLATSYNNLSAIYYSLGQLEPALEFQEKTVEIFEKTLDKNHPSLATSYNNLSTIYFLMEKYPDALQYAEKAVAILQHLFPNGHPNLDTMKANLETIKKK